MDEEDMQHLQEEGGYEFVEMSRERARGIIDLLPDELEDLAVVFDKAQGDLASNDRSFIVIKITE